MQIKQLWFALNSKWLFFLNWLYCFCNWRTIVLIINFLLFFRIIFRFFGSVRSLENPFPGWSWTARALCSFSSNRFVSNSLFCSSVELSHIFTTPQTTIAKTTAFGRHKVRLPKNQFVRNTNVRRRKSFRSCSILSNKSWLPIKARRLEPANVSRVCRRCVHNSFRPSPQSPSTPPTRRAVKWCRNSLRIWKITPKCFGVSRVFFAAVFEAWEIFATTLWSATTPSTNRCSSLPFTTCGRLKKIHTW